jgi:hypothetical protein
MPNTRDHRRTDGICIWDHEQWPCETYQIIQAVRKQVAEEILQAIEANPAFRPKWETGMYSAIKIAKGEHYAD